MSLGCRACLKKDHKEYVSLQTVFPEYKNKSILDLLSFVTSTNVRISSNLPSEICKNCLKDLKVAYKFITSFKNSQEFLQKYVENRKKHVSKTQQTKEIKVETFKDILDMDHSGRILIVNDDGSTDDDVFDEIFGDEESKNIKQENRNDLLKAFNEKNSSDNVIFVSEDNVMNSVEIEDNFDDSCEEASKFNQDQTHENYFNEKEEEDEKDVYRENIDENNISDQDNIDISQDILQVENNQNKNINNIQIVTIEDVIQTEKRKKEPTKTVLGPEDVLAMTHKFKKISSQSEGEIFQCNICKRTYDKRRKLMLHKLQLHNPNWETKYKCKTCGVQSKTNSGEKPSTLKCQHLNCHAKRNMGTKFYGFSIKDPLRQEKWILHSGNIALFAYIHHIAKHKNIRFTCSQCPKNYAAKAKLKEHILRIHEKKMDNKYLCPECGKGFKFSNALTYHMNKHTNSRDYICRYCGFACFALSALKRHERTHTGERPYTCKYCEKTFAGAAERQKHMFGHEGVFPYKCKFCEKPFIQTYNMKVHWLRHTGPYACELCKKNYAAPEILKFHYAHTHKIKDVVIECDSDKTEDEKEQDEIE